jgi:hypothetical protein
LIEESSRGITLGDARSGVGALRPAHARGDLFPERAQFRHALLGRITGNDRRVDRADRYAGDPVGMKIGLGERLIDAALIRAERAAAL